MEINWDNIWSTASKYSGQAFDYLKENPKIGAATLGGLASYYGSPKPQVIATPTTAQLNAATVPQMERDAAMRRAAILGAQGAKGGLNSADLYERSNISAQLSANIAQEQVKNQIMANQMAQSAADRYYKQRMQQWKNAMAGGMLGYEIFDKPKKEEPKQTQQQYPWLTPPYTGPWRPE